MNTHTTINSMSIVFAIALLAACSPSPDQAQSTAPASKNGVHNSIEAKIETVDEPMVVYMTPWCGCCTVWAELSEQAGFEVEIREVESLHPIKEELGVPPAMGSCHTAKTAGYFIEGHVPFEDIKSLLTKRPDARGLTVPGMPIGSPGMEQGNRRQAFDVYLVDHQGNTSVYNHYPSRH